MTHKSKLHRNIFLYYCSEFFSSLLFIIPIWVSYERQFLSFSEMSLIAALRLFITFLFEVPTGALAEIGRKRSVILGVFLEIIGALFIGSANDASFFWVAPLFIGIGGHSFQDQTWL